MANLKQYLLLLPCVLFFNCSPKKPEIVKVPCDNCALEVEITGRGEPLLVINGGPGLDRTGFASLANLLSGSYQVILYDQRGLGNSCPEKADSATISMDQYIEDIECLRTELNIEQWNVLGHSFGGMLASYYAARKPVSIKRLILSSSAGMDLELYQNNGIEMINSRLDSADLRLLNQLIAKYESGDTSAQLQDQVSQILSTAYVFNNDKAAWVFERLKRSDKRVSA